MVTSISSSEYWALAPRGPPTLSSGGLHINPMGQALQLQPPSYTRRNGAIKTVPSLPRS